MTALSATTDDGAIWHLWLSPYLVPCVAAAGEVGTFAALPAEIAAERLGVDARAGETIWISSKACWERSARR